MDGGDKYFKKKLPHSVMCQILMNWWKMTLIWHYHSSCKLVALELYNSYSYIVVTMLHKLHIYIWFHIERVASVATHAICPIAFTFVKYVELQGIANDHYNSKT
jgi:hypothetical protein